MLAHSTDKLDLLLTDVALPGAEGLALANRLRAERPDLPVLFMTGGDNHEDLAGEHVLMKPFTGADLLRAIARRIQGARHAETARWRITSSSEKSGAGFGLFVLAGGSQWWQAAAAGRSGLG